MNTLFYYDPIFLEHETGPHPECPGRLSAILSHLQETYEEKLTIKAPRRSEIDDAATLHSRNYLESVEAICRQGGGYLDADTPVSVRSFEAALHAVGAVLDAADDLMAGSTRSAFALVRPPGHHARPATGMGFCLINNIAVAATYLQKHHGLERILIVDFDVHHGNGTQEMFYKDKNVFFLSSHRYPFYPGTGSAEEQGAGPGKGFNRNLPLDFGLPPEDVVDLFSSTLNEVAAAHKPEAMLVSAGFDAFAEDPIAGLGLLPEHFGALGRAIRNEADRFCSGKVLSTLEGGYSLAGLPLCLAAYAEGLE